MLPRLLVAALVPAVVASGLTLPVIGGDGPRSPITPSLRTLPLAGLDPVAVRETEHVMASWSDLIHDHAVEPLGLVPLDEPIAVATSDDVPVEPVVATVPTDAEPFGLIGVTSDEPLDPQTRVVVRVREGDDWSVWQPMVVSDHGPDPGSAEAADIRFGTEPLLAADADGYQIRIDTPGGEEPDGLELVLIDNPIDPADDFQETTLPMSTAAAGAWSAPMPAIITRAEWGADESLRRAEPSISATIKAGFIHHTASSSNYSPEAAAQQVRNLYAWFTKGRRYSDIAYNFLVDRYGRIYEGRAGGVDQAVVGAHTAGFNADTFAISAIGNYHKTRPKPEELAAVTESMSQLVAWKLAMHHRDPNATTVLISDSGSGTSRYKAGQAATALVVGGHKDIGKTSCPGKFLEPQLPAIRSAAVAKIGASMFNPTVSAAVPFAGATPLSVVATANAPMTWQMTVTSRCGAVVRTIGGSQGAPGEMRMDWDLRDDAGNPVPPGTYTFTVQAQAGEEPVYPWVGAGRVLATPESPPDPCGPPESFTLSGAGFGHGVGMSQWGAYAMALEGRDAASIVTHYYTGTSVAPVQDDMDVRINVLYRVPSTQVRGEALEPGGGQIEVVMADRSVVAGPANAFTFTARGGAVGVAQEGVGDLGVSPTVTVRWAGTRNPGAAAGGATLLQVIGPRGSFASEGNRYRYGHVEISPSANALNVVNVLRLHDEYLYGISEVSNTWPEAALQAQVLAARSYALNKIANGVRRQCDCHMDNGKGPFTDQTFTGWSKPSSPRGQRWVRAVDATLTSENTGLAILYDGKPINAFYSASSGGRTNASRDVWGGDLPYVQSVDDPWSLHADNPNRSWSVQVPQATMAKAFGVGEVFRIEVAEQGSSGAPRSFRAILADGSSVQRTSSQLRSALGLRSAHITAVNDQGVGAPPPAAPPTEAPPAAPPEVQPVGGVTLQIKPGLQPKRGSSFTIRGKVKGGGKHVIHRQAFVNGSWQTVNKVRTDKKGRYSIRVAKAKPAGATYTYRVLAVKKKQVVGVSRELTVTVQSK